MCLRGLYNLNSILYHYTLESDKKNTSKILVNVGKKM